MKIIYVEKRIRDWEIENAWLTILTLIQKYPLVHNYIVGKIQNR